MTLLEDKPMVVFDDEHLLDRYSGSLGTVYLTPSAVEPSMWGQSPWLITSEYGYDGHESAGIRYVVKPEYYLWCFHHPANIGPIHLWVD